MRVIFWFMVREEAHRIIKVPLQSLKSHLLLFSALLPLPLLELISGPWYGRESQTYPWEVSKIISLSLRRSPAPEHYQHSERYMHGGVTRANSPCINKPFHIYKGKRGVTFINDIKKYCYRVLAINLLHKPSLVVW